MPRSKKKIGQLSSRNNFNNSTSSFSSLTKTKKRANLSNHQSVNNKLIAENSNEDELKDFKKICSDLISFTDYKFLNYSSSKNVKKFFKDYSPSKNLNKVIESIHNFVSSENYNENIKEKLTKINRKFNAFSNILEKLEEIIEKQNLAIENFQRKHEARIKRSEQFRLILARKIRHREIHINLKQKIIQKVVLFISNNFSEIKKRLELEQKMNTIMSSPSLSTMESFYKLIENINNMNEALENLSKNDFMNNETNTDSNFGTKDYNKFKK